MSPGGEPAVYRAHIYGAYVTGRSNASATESIAGPAPRLLYLRRLFRTCMSLNCFGSM